MKKTLIIVAVIILAIIVYLFISKDSVEPVVENETPVTNETTNSTSTQTTAPVDKTKTVLGKSVEGHDIIAYHFGTGEKEVLFVGGMHGGYSWNTALVAFNLVDFLKDNPSAVPANVKVTVVPLLNPDGFNEVIGTTTGQFNIASVTKDATKLASGRFNGANVDLNRNFDCDWQTVGTWNKTPVSGGSTVFSEPESRAIKGYIEANEPASVVVWYSAAGGVFASNCHGDVLAETDTLTKTFATASGYPAHSSFDFYATTGDMTNWLAKIGIPAISVLLSNHTDVEWSKNLEGIKAVLNYYRE